MTRGGFLMNTDLVEEIRELKRRKRAIILAHNYQNPEIYEVADFIGDSLELSRQAQNAKTDLIVFCGVRFMAETAKLLNPQKTVILAEPKAGCQMAQMITPPALRHWRAELECSSKALPYICAYVNTTAAIKAEADICCTSANVLKVIQSLPRDRPILFVPDKNLARYAARETGYHIIPWEGFCYVHAWFTVEDIKRARAEYPNAVIIAHPECSLEVIDASDRVASTGGMLRLARDYDELVLATEVGMCNRIRREYPGKRCYPLRRTAICRNMKLTSLKKVHDALLGKVDEIVIPEDVAERARRSLLRMMAIV
ncbi:MAG: quinolinate synthase NadA [bacterium]